MTQKILIAYFSLPDENYYPTGIQSVKVGNTAKLAQALANECGGELFEIKSDHRYPASYHPCTDEAKKLLAQNFRPQLTTDIAVADYDVICLGFPIWWGLMPTEVMAFVEKHQADFVGKNVLPFCTHEGSGFDRSLGYLKQQLPQSSILKGIDLYGHIAQDSAALAKQQAKLHNFLAQI